MAQETEKLNEEVLEEQESNEESAEKREDEKTFTQTELDEIIQKRLDREMKKFEEKRSEAEQLASMSAEERAKAEFEAKKAEWEKERETFEQERLKHEATKLLSTEGLPVSFVDYVAVGTAEEVKANIESFKTEWAKALDEAITDKLKGNPPASTGLQNKDIVNMTREEFGKLPYKERARMLSIDPAIMGKLK